MNAIDLLNLRKAIIEGDARKTVELTRGERLHQESGLWRWLYLCVK